MCENVGHVLWSVQHIAVLYRASYNYEEASRVNC